MENKMEKYKEYPLEINRELLVWEKWVKIREEETRHLATKLKKSPADLVMNLCENIRCDKERKVALEHAVIDEKATVRGTLWEQPIRLKHRQYCDPVYEVQRTKAEMGRPSIITHVGVPNYIKTNELGVSGQQHRKSHPLLNAQYEFYRNKREQQLNEKIKKIDPFKPSMNHLIVRGSKPKTPPKKLPAVVPVISLISADEPSQDALCSVYALRINNSVIFKEVPGQSLSYLRELQKESWHETCFTWTYYFNVPTKRVGRSRLFLENLGTVSLRYCWKKIKRSIPFIPEGVYEQVFFFNKNECVLFPGQKKNIYFSFVSEKPDLFNEYWELNICNVCFFDTLADKFLINLHGDATQNVEKILKDNKNIMLYINNKALTSIAIEVLDEIIIKVTTVQPQIYPYKHFCLEADMFVMKNPVCYYHQTVVMKMKEFYSEMKPREEWNLSIVSWREKMMDKEYDDRMKYYELLKQSHSKLLKPWFEGEDLLKQKYRAMKIILGKLADSFDSEYIRLWKMYNSVYEDNFSLPEIRLSDAVNPTLYTSIRNIFYITMYEHVSRSMELSAGILSSIDLNRWIDFDFCQT